ncbi:hypothetical protein TNCV_2815271 [Trichonephila clavipes]|nr:hypothetical protein TNCV_2815271 [Trichonephila clavipes]
MINTIISSDSMGDSIELFHQIPWGFNRIVSSDSILFHQIPYYYFIRFHGHQIPSFLTEYVLNCPELTTVELQGTTQTDGEVEDEFMKLPEGFAYLKDVEREFYENAFALVSKYYTRLKNI